MEKIVIDVYANYGYLLMGFSYYLSYMLYDFMQDDMIFSFYGNWLKKEQKFNKIVELNNSNESNQLMEFIKIPSWKKPLGLCLKCFHIWIFIILQIIFIKQFSLLLFILCLSFSYHKLVKNYYN